MQTLLQKGGKTFFPDRVSVYHTNESDKDLRCPPSGHMTFIRGNVDAKLFTQHRNDAYATSHCIDVNATVYKHDVASTLTQRCLNGLPAGRMIHFQGWQPCQTVFCPLL